MRRTFLSCCALAALPALAGAQAADVHTRGEYRGSFEENGGKRLYARIRIASAVKLPFSTLTYRVMDRKLLEGLKSGAQVEFKAQRADGENVLTSMRPR